ncbi:SCO family protein [Solimonas variicoloris]|uniref:SCO family protein n=1 Tax=Solimonas variicoloris TaxID=254408 RepID=UPI00035FF008|nr:SCO family protein [Solimonas variicoloris]
MNQVPRGRGQLLLLAALFFGPLVAAVLLYFVFPQFQPQGRTNYGELIDPARPLPALALVDADGKALDREALRGRWTYLYLGGERCDAVCANKLFQFRQIRTLLNEKRMRVQRVYLAPDAAALPALREQLGATHPDLQLYAESAAPVLRAFLQAGGPARDPQSVYLIDPLGNWLMVYPAEVDYRKVLDDIKKLLRISQIG